MTMRIPVKDSVSGQTLWMWEVDAEEALRYDTQARYSVPVVAKTPTKKNPGGRGF